MCLPLQYGMCMCVCTHMCVHVCVALKACKILWVFIRVKSGMMVHLYYIGTQEAEAGGYRIWVLLVYIRNWSLIWASSKSKTEAQLRQVLLTLTLGDTGELLGICNVQITFLSLGKLGTEQDPSSQGRKKKKPNFMRFQETLPPLASVVRLMQDSIRIELCILYQWFSHSLMLRAANTVPHVMVTPNQKFFIATP